MNEDAREELEMLGRDLGEEDLCKVLRIAAAHEKEISSLYSAIAKNLRDDSHKRTLDGIALEKRMHAVRISGMIERMERDEEERFDDIVPEGWETHRL